MCLWLLGRRSGEGIVGAFGMDIYTLLYLKWITNEDLLYTHGTQLKVMRLGGKGVGGEWVLLYVWLRPFTAHLKLSQYCLLIGCTP